MQKSIPQRKALNFALIGVAVVAAITALRLVVLWVSDTDLFFDESQYWLWGQNLDFGYYSKPPLIGWTIRAITTVAGSDGEFSVRMAAPLCHGVAALFLMASARRLFGGEAGLAVAVAYLSMPLIAVGSFLISTDTILLPFWTAALLLWLRQTDTPKMTDAALMGLCLGLGMMAKYAAIYFVGCAVLVQIFLPSMRLPWRNLLLAALVLVVVLSPNVVWNLLHDFATLSHTADNVDWVKSSSGPTLHPARLAEFVLSQAAVMGPVFFVAYVWIAAIVLRRGSRIERWLLCMSLPIVTLVCVQALLSKAYANWAAMTWPAALLLVVPVLLLRARWALWAGLAVNVVLSLAVAIAATQATQWRRGDELVLSRYTGRAAMVQAAVKMAHSEGLHTLLADDRQVLADVFYYGRNSGLSLAAVPHSVDSPHYYADMFALPSDMSEDVLFIGQHPPCEAARRIGPLDRNQGAYFEQGLSGYAAPGSCWERES